MAKSKIIKDLTAGNCSLAIALKRLYVILSDLNDEDLILWVKKELNGYDGEDELPCYRNVKCSPMGSYQIVGYGKLMTYNNQPLPMIGFDEEMKKNFQRAKLTMSVSSISEALNEYRNGKSIGNPISMELWPYFESGTNITITGANRVIDESEVRKVLDNIESKVLDVLLFLERKFGNLDELDILENEYETSDLQSVIKSCKEIIFENCTFQTLNDTKIKAKNMASTGAKIDSKKTTNKNSNTGKGINYVEKHTDISADISIAQKDEKKPPFWKRWFGKRSK